MENETKVKKILKTKDKKRKISPTSTPMKTKNIKKIKLNESKKSPSPKKKTSSPKKKTSSPTKKKSLSTKKKSQTPVSPTKKTEKWKESYSNDSPVKKTTNNNKRVGTNKQTLKHSTTSPNDKTSIHYYNIIKLHQISQEFQKMSKLPNQISNEVFIDNLNLMDNNKHLFFSLNNSYHTNIREVIMFECTRKAKEELEQIRLIDHTNLEDTMENMSIEFEVQAKFNPKWDFQLAQIVRDFMMDNFDNHVETWPSKKQQILATIETFTQHLHFLVNDNTFEMHKLNYPCIRDAQTQTPTVKHTLPQQTQTIQTE